MRTCSGAPDAAYGNISREGYGYKSLEYPHLCKLNSQTQYGMIRCSCVRRVNLAKCQRCLGCFELEKKYLERKSARQGGRVWKGLFEVFQGLRRVNNVTGCFLTPEAEECRPA